MRDNRFSRRAFVGGAVGLAATAAAGMKGGVRPAGRFAPARRRLPNPFVENGKPVVAVVRGESYAAMLAKGMELLGGFARYGSDKAVHLKPNFVAPVDYPTTTDGDSLLATVEALARENFNDVAISEWGTAGRNYSLLPTAAFYHYELKQKSEAGGFKCNDLVSDEVVEVQDDRWEVMNRVGVFRSQYEAPMIINMPTLKQHSWVQFTCALKNTMGQIDNRTRKEMHDSHGDQEVLQLEGEEREERLYPGYLAISEIAQAIDSEMTIIDARTVLGRNHHVRSGGVRCAGNRVIISGSALAADRVAAEVLAECYEGFQVSMTDITFEHAEKLGLGSARLEDIVVKEAAV